MSDAASVSQNLEYIGSSVTTDVNDSLTMEHAENIHLDNFTVLEIKPEDDVEQGFGKLCDEYATEDLCTFKEVRICTLHRFLSCIIVTNYY